MIRSFASAHLTHDNVHAWLVEAADVDLRAHGARREHERSQNSGWRLRLMLSGEKFR
jgi:hypothetical protein